MVWPRVMIQRSHLVARDKFSDCYRPEENDEAPDSHGFRPSLSAESLELKFIRTEPLAIAIHGARRRAGVPRTGRFSCKGLGRIRRD
jgi:hypothetical protein